MIRTWLLAFALSIAAPLAFVPIASAQDHSSPFNGALPDTGDVDPKSDPRVLEITKTLACNCGTCPHEPVNVCTCGTAQRLRAEVAAGVNRGDSKDVILAMMVGKFSETILPRPPFRGLALFAYLGPFVAIAAVGSWLFVILKRSKRRAEQRPPVAGSGAPGAPPADDPYLAAVNAELEKGR